MKYVKFYLVFICINIIDSGAESDPTILDKKNNLKIVGGIPASASNPEFPWIVLIRNQHTPTGFGGGRICAGSILNSEWIVTSVHCMMHSNLSSYEVIGGLYNRKYAIPTNSKLQYKRISRIVKYPHYNPKTYQHDIALVKVYPKFQYNNAVGSIRLLSIRNSTIQAGTLTITAGWGTPEYQTAPPSDILQKVTTPVIDNKECRLLYQGIYNIGRQHICTGEKNKSSCSGDSGGPVMCRSKSTSNSNKQLLILCGIVSGAKGCGDEKYPQVNANVPYYKDWIKRIIES